MSYSGVHGCRRMGSLGLVVSSGPFFFSFPLFSQYPPLFVIISTDQPPARSRNASIIYVVSKCWQPVYRSKRLQATDICKGMEDLPVWGLPLARPFFLHICHSKTAGMSAVIQSRIRGCSLVGHLSWWHSFASF